MGSVDGPELLSLALAQGSGGPVEIDEITCLDPELLGHAFKYDGAQIPYAGVHAYRLAWRCGGLRRSAVAMLKAKPSEAAILRVYGGLLDKAGIHVDAPLEELLASSDYSTPNLKEAVLFRDFAGELGPLLPRPLGVHIDAGRSYALRIEEKLGEGSVILSPDDDSTRAWHPDLPQIVLAGLALLHARFEATTQPLAATGWMFVRDQAALMRGTPLWAAFLAFLETVHPEFGDDLVVHRRLLESLPAWSAEVDRLPRTLLYGDVNPQNLAFARDGDGFRLCLFDWERAIIGPAQRDLAEHLVYTLPPDFEPAQAEREIAAYLDARAACGTAPDAATFRAGLRLMVQDLLVDRLPLMLVVRHVAGKRPGAVQGYANAHRLLRVLG